MSTVSTGRRLFVACVVGLLIAAQPVNAQNDALAQARQLLDQKDAKRAYALLKPLESDRAGESAFDYLLGVAALDSGRPTEAIFALERVLAVDPAHAQARAEIGRAYFQIGENAAARRELQAVRRQSVPAPVAASIDRFLAAIDRATSAESATERTAVAAYLEATLGHDSNLNSGVTNNQVALPAFGGAVVQLDAAGVRARDEFFAVGGGVSVRHPLQPNLSIIGALNANGRWNFSFDQFNTAYVDGHAGLLYVTGQHALTLAVQANQYHLDNRRFRQVLGGLGQWQFNVDRSTQVSAYVQAMRLEYPGQEIRDADRWVAGVGAAHSFGSERPVVFAGLYVGEENERNAGVPNLGHRLWGARLGVQAPVRDNISVFATGTYEERKYGGVEPVFLVTRNDDQYGLSLGMHWSPARAWRVTPQISWTNNESNVIVNDYRREIYSVTLRREF